MLFFEVKNWCWGSWKHEAIPVLANSWRPPGFCLSVWVFAFNARISFVWYHWSNKDVRWCESNGLYGSIFRSSETPILCPETPVVFPWFQPGALLSLVCLDFGCTKTTNSLFRSLKFDAARASMVSWSLFRSFLGLFRPLLPTYKPLDQVPLVGGKVTWSCSASRLGVMVASRVLSSARLLIVVTLLQGIYSIICICSSASCAVNW